MDEETSKRLKALEARVAELEIEAAGRRVVKELGPLASAELENRRAERIRRDGRSA